MTIGSNLTVRGPGPELARISCSGAPCATNDIPSDSGTAGTLIVLEGGTIEGLALRNSGTNTGSWSYTVRFNDGELHGVEVDSGGSDINAASVPTSSGPCESTRTIRDSVLETGEVTPSGSSQHGLYAQSAVVDVIDSTIVATATTVGNLYGIWTNASAVADLDGVDIAATGNSTSTFGYWNDGSADPTITTITNSTIVASSTSGLEIALTANSASGNPTVTNSTLSGSPSADGDMFIANSILSGASSAGEQTCVNVTNTALTPLDGACD